MTAPPALHRPADLAEAVSLLADPSRTRVPLAGATWVMRDPIRQECTPDGYVAVAGLPELRMLETRPDEYRFGAGLTHAELAAATAGYLDLRVLHQAAALSANPAVRHLATVGGNLCTAGFPAADLVPALLSLDARVTLVDATGQRELPVAEYLSARSMTAPALLTEVRVPRRQQLSGHARLPLRRAGDYPVAIASLVVIPADEGTVREARVAVGSVEPTPRRWTEVEALLRGGPVEPAAAAEAARRCAQTLRGRDGVEAPGWYRERVVPVLLRRAMTTALARST